MHAPRQAVSIDVILEVECSVGTLPPQMDRAELNSSVHPVLGNLFLGK
jgi:hypothetical protein